MKNVRTVHLGDVVAEVEYDYTPPMRGRYSGPPEHCYPDEDAEVEITAVTVLSGGDTIDDPEAFAADLEFAIIEAETQDAIADQIDYEERDPRNEW